MSRVFESAGAILAEVNTGPYGTDAAPTDALHILGQPDYAHDDTFEQDELLELSPSSKAGDRQHNKIDLSFQNPLGYLVDEVAAVSGSHACLLAGGAKVHDANGATGVGNFVEYRPTDVNFADVTFDGLLKEDGAGLLSRLKHLGSRGNFTLNVQGGSRITLDMAVQALHAFWEEFAALTPPATIGRGVKYFDSKCISATVKEKGSADTPFALGINSFSFSPNNEFEDQSDDIEACDTGVSEVIIQIGQMTGSMNLKFVDTLIANSNPGNWIRRVHDNNIDLEFVLTYNDGVNLFSATFPAMRWQDFQLASGNTRKNFDVNFIASGNTNFDNRHVRRA